MKGPMYNHFFFYFRSDNNYFLTTGFNDAFYSIAPGDHLEAFDSSWQTTCVSWHDDESVFVNFRDWKWTRHHYLTSPAAETSLQRLSNFISANQEDDVRVVFGPYGNYVAWTQDEALTLSTWADEETCARMSPIVMGAWLDVVALGVGGAYYIKTRSGHTSWNLYGRYAALSRALKMAPPGDVTFVALNPDRENEFFLLLKNKIAVFCLPDKIALDVRKRLEIKKYTCVVLSGREGEFAIPEELTWEKLLDYTHAMVAIGSKCTVM